MGEAQVACGRYGHYDPLSRSSMSRHAERKFRICRPRTTIPPLYGEQRIALHALMPMIILLSNNTASHSSLHFILRIFSPPCRNAGNPMPLQAIEMRNVA